MADSNQFRFDSVKRTVLFLRQVQTAFELVRQPHGENQFPDVMKEGTGNRTGEDAFGKRKVRRNLGGQYGMRLEIRENKSGNRPRRLETAESLGCQHKLFQRVQ